MTNETFASLLIRFGMGGIFLIYGINKMMAYPGIVDRLTGGFADTWLPSFAVVPLGYIIPIAELVLGITLVLGIKYRESLVATGLLMIVLTVGMAIQGNSETVARNLVYLLVCAYGVTLAQHDRFSLVK